MFAFLISAGIVALAEMGDKTQLLAIILTARFCRPYPIILGILAATILNHAGASAIGSWLNKTIEPLFLQNIIGVSFILMAIWMLIPDKLNEDHNNLPKYSHLSIFSVTLFTFFLVSCRNGR